MKIAHAFLGMSLLATGVPALAQSPAAPAPQSVAMPVDDAKMAVARQVVVKLIPPGTYKKLMGSTMDRMMSGMTDSLKALPIRQLAELGGLSPDKAQALDKINLEQVMAIYDPHWQERSQLTMHAMFSAMGDFFTTIEPELREAMAHAYASQLTIDDLSDLNRYFATPVGTKFAGMQMTIMNDPAMIAEMKNMMPKMMQQMPHFVEAAQQATKSLPPPRKVEDLTPAEKAKIARMLGVDEGKLSNPKSAI